MGNFMDERNGRFRCWSCFSCSVLLILLLLGCSISHIFAHPSSISNLNSTSSGWKPFFPGRLETKNQNLNFHHRTMTVTPNPNHQQIQLSGSGSSGSGPSPNAHAKYSQLKPVYLPPKLSFTGNYKSTYTSTGTGNFANAWKPTAEPPPQIMQQHRPQNMQHSMNRIPIQNSYIPPPQAQAYTQGSSNHQNHQVQPPQYNAPQFQPPQPTLMPQFQQPQNNSPPQNQSPPQQLLPQNQSPPQQLLPQSQPQNQPPPPQYAAPQPQAQESQPAGPASPDLSNTEMRFLFHRPEDENLIKSSIMKESVAYNENVSFLRGPSLKFSRKQTIVLPPKKRNVIYVMLKEPELNTNLEIIEPMEQAEPEVNIIYEKVGPAETRHYYSTNKSGKLEEIHPGDPEHGLDHEGAYSSNQHKIIHPVPIPNNSTSTSTLIGKNSTSTTNSSNNNQQQVIQIVNPCLPNYSKKLRK